MGNYDKLLSVYSDLRARKLEGVTLRKFVTSPCGNFIRTGIALDDMEGRVLLNGAFTLAGLKDKPLLNQYIIDNPPCLCTTDIRWGIANELASATNNHRAIAKLYGVYLPRRVKV